MLSNYKKDLCAFLPVNSDGEPAIKFVVAPQQKKPSAPVISVTEETVASVNSYDIKLNPNYRFVYGDMSDGDDLNRALQGVTDVVLLAGLVGDPITKNHRLSFQS